MQHNSATDLQKTLVLICSSFLKDNSLLCRPLTQRQHSLATNFLNQIYALNEEPPGLIKLQTREHEFTPPFFR